MKIINRSFIWLIRQYQIWVSPLTGQNCRFFPSCSQYAVESFREFHALKALWRTCWRILRCAPWGKSGYDPVVKPKNQSK